jgi:subtilisin family serine protease
MPFRFVILIGIILNITGFAAGQSVRVPPFLQVEMARDPLAFEPGRSREKSRQPQDYILLGLEMAEDGEWEKIGDLGGALNTRLGNRATVRLPKTSVYALLELRGLKEVFYGPPVYPTNQRAVEHVQADKVHAGLDPLPQGYAGRGVIVGIIDTGIDFGHEDFRDPKDPSRSRILYIWDQLIDKGEKPTDFSYGAEWTREQISRELGANPPGIVSHIDTLFEGSGHGTHVSGTAAGASGVAYEADIIAVASNYTEAGIVDAASYIKQKAAQLGRPCVINLSLGSNTHAHDGTDFLSESLSILAEGTTGLAVVASAGNDGDDPLHWGGFQLSDQPASVYFFGVTGLWTFIRAPKNTAASIELSIAVDSAQYNAGSRKLTSRKEIGRTDWIKLSEIGENAYTQTFRYSNGPKAVDLFVYNITSSRKDYAEYVVYLDEGLNRYNWRNNVDKLDLFRFSLRGRGTFNAWFGSYEALTYSRPEEAGVPVANYRPANTDLSISSPGDGRNVITVGAYANRPFWRNVNGDDVLFPPRQNEGDLANFSSYGPTFDGRIKPEITAPGKAVVSAFPRYNDLNPALLTDAEAKYAAFAGTSMAAPVVSGCIALLLQQNPELDFETIRNLLISTAMTDQQTLSEGALPNGHWGYGKINIFEAMIAARQATPNQPAQLIVSPNPAREEINVRYFTGGSESGRLRLFDLTGRQVTGAQTLNRGENRPVPVRHLAPGMYLLEWTDGEERVVRKVVVQ